MPNYTYKGPVRDNLAAKKKLGYKGWMIPISDLRGAIDACLRDLDPDDEEYQHVVFSVHKKPPNPDKENQQEQPESLYILGVVKEDTAAPTTAKSERPPGEFDDFPPWPPG